MTTNKTSQAVHDFLQAREGDEGTLDNIMRKYKMMEEALQELHDDGRCPKCTFPGMKSVSHSNFCKALSFNPLSE